MKLFTGKVFSESYMADFEHKINEYDSVLKHLDNVKKELERFTRYSKEDIIKLEHAEKSLTEYSNNLKAEIIKKCTEFNKALEDNTNYLKNGTKYLDSMLVKTKANFKKDSDSLFNDYKKDTSMALYSSIVKNLQDIIEVENKKIDNNNVNNHIKEVSKKAKKLCLLFQIKN